MSLKPSPNTFHAMPKTKGKRSSLRFSRTMLHQSSGGAVGNIQDAEITMREWIKINDILFNLLGEYCNKDPEQVKLDSSRDLWLSSQEALDYGIIDEIVCGMAKGVDIIGREWAITNKIPVKEFPADWKKYGKAAGPIRNKQMADYADQAIVIYNPVISKGSKNMIDQMKKLGKPVLEVTV